MKLFGLTKGERRLLVCFVCAFVCVFTLFDQRWKRVVLRHLWASLFACFFYFFVCLFAFCLFLCLFDQRWQKIVSRHQDASVPQPARCAAPSWWEGEKEKNHGEKVGFCRSKQVVGSPKWIDPPLDPTPSCKKGSERPCRIVRTRKKNCSFTWKTIGEVQIPKITRLTISWRIYTNARRGLFSHSILESSEKQIPFSES